MELRATLFRVLLALSRGHVLMVVVLNSTRRGLQLVLDFRLRMQKWDNDFHCIHEDADAII